MNIRVALIAGAVLSLAGAIAVGVALSGGTNSSAQGPYRAINPQVARDNEDPDVATPTATATPTQTATATPSQSPSPSPSASPSASATTSASPTATATATATPTTPVPGGGEAALAALIQKGSTATFTADYAMSGSSTGAVTISQKGANKRELIPPSDNSTGGSVIRTSSNVYICDTAANACEQYAPDDDAVRNVLKGPWWTASAGAAMTTGGASVATAPGRTVAGIAATCFVSSGGAAPMELCLDPTTGVELYYRLGSGGSAVTIIAQTFSASANDGDFVPPYPIA